ncbi:PREDICTED: uncharacterized protein LOC106749841 [Dinoponera quadriceps]|uniref:Uncharacterized protein LOC106749841 n=1 Tax=Dinoponera quadriceps TaxID=609295 RepID=A0A6P3Y4F4_DINQU|nr:PREDICTED: uncharacterized protein LOC106749841 [Dinoponera quadriceps]
MVLRVFSILSAVVLGLCVAEKLDLPVPTCKRDAANYTSCLKRAIIEVWPLFVKGLPAEFDFPPLDPSFYEYQHMVLDRGDLHAEVTASNVTIEGFEATHFVAVRPHYTDDIFRLEIDVRIPRLFIDGICEAHGSIGSFRMSGKGPFNMTVEGAKVTWDITGSVIDDTWIINHFNLLPTIKKLKAHLNNLFDGNQEINELATMFVNEYWPPIYRWGLPAAVENWDKTYSDLLTRLFSKLSFSKVFP